MSHGGNIKKLRQLAAKNKDLIDFSASINPLGSPDWLRQEISHTISLLSNYPEIDNNELILAAAEQFNLPAANIIACNGSTELIFSLPEVLNYSTAVIAEPAYIDYRASCQHAELKINSIKLEKENNFQLNLDKIEEALIKPSLVFLGHPNNPTGTLLNHQTISAFIQIHKESTFIIDEAYLPFVSDNTDKSFIQYINKFPNLIVLRSLTKIYAIAGLRLGLAFTDSVLAEKIRRHQIPWNINTLSQHIGLKALSDQKYLDQSISTVTEYRAELIRELNQFDDITVFPSSANFILCRLTGKLTADKLFSLLIKEGIAIRVCSDFLYLDKSYFRIAVRTQEENRLLIENLKKILEPKKPVNISRKPTPALMMLGSSSNAGKSVLVAALCRILLQDGIKVAPFKSQNMALNSFVTMDGLEMGRAQASQAQAARLEADVRMNPILLKPNTDTGSQIIVMGKPVGNMKVQDYIRYKDTAFSQAKTAYDSLAAEYDVILLEGAGSPGEVNLKKHDIVNTRMAQYAQASSLLVGDIDRGGVYASFIGMYETFEEWERRQVKGFIVNRFRGDATLLADAHRYVKDFTGRDIFGVVPYIKDLGLPEEDSVSFNETFLPGDDKDRQTLDLALIALPHISNFTDFDAIAKEPDVKIRLVKYAQELGNPDCILLPGSKNVIGDRNFLHYTGLEELIIQHSKNTIICGICGGFQILGKTIADPYNLEGGGKISGLNLLPLNTVLVKDKTLTRASAKHIISGCNVYGYEIHHGETAIPENAGTFLRTDNIYIGAGDEKIWGTYLHGIFDSDPFRRYFINTIHKSRNNTISSAIRYHYDLEPAYNRLADITRAALDMKKIYTLLGI